MSLTIKAVLLTGTIGSGKTSLAEAVSEELHEHGIRHALVDLDWLAQVYPVPDPLDPHNMNLQLENLRVMWPNFLTAGITHAVCAGTIFNAQQLRGLRDAMPEAKITVIRVVAPSEVIKARFRARDRSRLLADFLARTDQLATEIEEARIEDLAVSNDDLPIHDLARRTLWRLGWIKETAR